MGDSLIQHLSYGYLILHPRGRELISPFQTFGCTISLQPFEEHMVKEKSMP